VELLESRAARSRITSKTGKAKTGVTLAKFLSSRIPLIATCIYAAIVFLLLILAAILGITGKDEFGYSGVPILYITSPLSLLLYKTHGFLFSIGMGCAVNAFLLYSSLKVVINHWLRGKAGDSPV
jgi:hypothetical protein